HHDENDEREDDEIDDDRDEVAVREQRNPGLGERLVRHRSVVARWRPAQHDEPVREIEAAGDAADHRHDDVLHERVDDLAERGADDYPAGEIDHAAFYREFAKLTGKRHGVPFRRAWRYTAASPDSPVRMRTTCSTAVTKILPSPILPVCAALTMASTARSTMASGSTTSTFTLGRKSTTYSAPR